MDKSITGRENQQQREYGSWWEQYRRQANDEAKRSMLSGEHNSSGGMLLSRSHSSAYTGSMPIYAGSMALYTGSAYYGSFYGAPGSGRCIGSALSGLYGSAQCVSHIDYVECGTHSEGHAEPEGDEPPCSSTTGADVFEIDITRLGYGLRLI